MINVAALEYAMELMIEEVKKQGWEIQKGYDNGWYYSITENGLEITRLTSPSEVKAFLGGYNYGIS